MITHRVVHLEANAMTNPRIRAAREATMPKAKARTIVLRDDQPAPPHRGPGRAVILRVITARGPKRTGPGSKDTNERVLRAAVPARPASPAKDPGKRGKPACAKPEAEMTEDELAEELRKVEAEIAELERRTK